MFNHYNLFAFIIGDTLETGKFYRDLFLEEVAASSAVLDAVHSESERLSKQIEKVQSSLTNLNPNSRQAEPSTSTLSLQALTGPTEWDEWLRFCDNVHDFDHHKCQYILITDAISREDMEHFSPLRNVPWKLVLDFDPSSEERGMYCDFVMNEGKSNLINMITPAEIQCLITTTLVRSIDTHKTQWMFVNGREKDHGAGAGPRELQDWKSSYVKQISRFFSCCSDPEKLDKHKPFVCLILPFRKETVPFLTLTLERLTENFNEFHFNFVGIRHDHCSTLDSQINIRLTNLSPELLSLGMKDLFHVSSSKEYRMPTSQVKLPVKLTQNQLLYLKEYFDVLYLGCEDLPVITDDPDSEERLKKILNEHRESFMSGKLDFFG